MDTTRPKRSAGSLPPRASATWFRYPTSRASPGWPAVRCSDHQERTMNVNDTIREQVTGHPVVLYMKGSPQFPMCGFSATATQLLKMAGAEQVFTVDVLK